ncbi:MAG: lytic transglycosylase domain-containing protein [Chitinophagales bacterium]
MYRKLWLPISVTVFLLIIFNYIRQNNQDYIPNTKIVTASIIPFESGDDGEEEAPPQRIHPVRITGDMFFAGEEVPIYDYEVRERLDKELLKNTFWHSSTILNYKLSNKYFEEIKAILDKNGVPQDFVYLCVAESNLQNLVSPAGAAGFWQIMKQTGKGYGLEINDEVDERYHLLKSTEVACQYLKEAKAKFGTWTLAAASYNMGMGGLQNRLNDQMVDNYYDLYLNTETSRYVFRILAFKSIFENPEEFGFNFTDDDLYSSYPYEEVIQETSIPDLAQYAIDNGTTYKMIKLLNPWLRDNSLTISTGNSYRIKIADTMEEED